MKPIYELAGKKYSNEQEIIEAGVQVIYWYCDYVKGRWRDIEQIVIEDDGWGYYYARSLVKGRYDPELETWYLMRHSGSYYVKWYIDELVRYGNV